MIETVISIEKTQSRVSAFTPPHPMLADHVKFVNTLIDMRTGCLDAAKTKLSDAAMTISDRDFRDLVLLQLARVLFWSSSTKKATNNLEQQNKCPERPSGAQRENVVESLRTIAAQISTPSFADDVDEYVVELTKDSSAR